MMTGVAYSEPRSGQINVAISRFIHFRFDSYIYSGFWHIIALCTSQSKSRPPSPRDMGGESLLIVCKKQQMPQYVEQLLRPKNKKYPHHLGTKYES